MNAGEQPWRPTREQLAAAKDKRVRDLIAPDLRVLFCGINPGLYSAAVGHHFARPGNRFWPALAAAGFTPRVISPFEEQILPTFGLGITNIAARASAAADELSDDELRAGAKLLGRKVQKYKPRYLAVLGVSAFRVAFAQPKAKIGPQLLPIGGTRAWILPNPSGLNAHYQADALATVFAELRQEAFRD